MPMMIVIVIFVVAIAGGGAGGYFAKQQLASGGSGDAHAEEMKDDGHGDDHGDDHDDHNDDKDHKGKDDHGESHDKHKKSKSKKKDDDHGGDDLADGVNYYKFSRQFVVPIIGDEGVRSLVLLDLNLEMDSSAAEGFYVREPKLRDVLMEELLDLANEGRFEGRLTDRRNLDLVRMDLLNAVQDVAGSLVHDVLILDIMRQDL